MTLIESIDPSTVSSLTGGVVLISGSGLSQIKSIYLSFNSQYPANAKAGFAGPVELVDDTLISVSIPAAEGLDNPISNVPGNFPFSPEFYCYAQDASDVKNTTPTPASIAGQGNGSLTYVYTPAVGAIDIAPVLWTNGTFQGTITLNEAPPPGGTTVTLAISGSGNAISPRSLLFDSGNTSLGFTIVTSATPGEATVTATAVTASTDPTPIVTEVTVGISASQILLMVTDETPENPPGPSPLASGQPVTITIYVRTAPSSNASIALSGSLFNLIDKGIPSQVVLGAGATSASFTFTPTVKTGLGGNTAITATYLGNSATIDLSVAKPPKHLPPVGGV
jgi:hypothetical protein